MVLGYNNHDMDCSSLIIAAFILSRVHVQMSCQIAILRFPAVVW